MKPPFLAKFPVFVQDIMNSWRWQAMSAEERGCYVQLLFLNWTEGGLPGDIVLIFKLGGISGHHPLVEDAFPVCQDGLRRNPKLERVRESENAWIASQRAKSAKGGEANRLRLASLKPVASPRAIPRARLGLAPLTPDQTLSQTLSTETVLLPLDGTGGVGGLEARKPLMPPAAAPPLDEDVVGSVLQESGRRELLGPVLAYLDGRRERRQKRQTVRGLRMALKGLADLDSDGARSVIEAATASGWLGWPADAAAKVSGLNGARPYGFETAFEANARDMAKRMERDGLFARGGIVPPGRLGVA